MRLLQIYLFKVSIAFVNCNVKDELLFKSKNALPYFKREADTKSEDPEIEISHSDGLKTNLVSVFVDNVKEIFNDYATEFYERSTPTTYIKTAKTLRPSNKIITKVIEEDHKLTEKFMEYENTSKVLGFVDYKFYTITTTEAQKTVNHLPMMLSKDTKSHKKFERNLEHHALSVINSLVMNTTDNTEIFEPWHNRRSCIFCNNVISEDCNDPTNKLIQSVLCDHEDDICFSQHTPFGIIDRGCFSLDYSLTTFVCSCNLCNYMSSSELPYIFSSKRDWVDNVMELSRTRSFRKSVFKDMACLQCEVNTTTLKGDAIENANCLEGNIGTVPTQICKENEVCAVKSIRSEGYIWRGCVSAPLYNYWMALCDSDLCNYDSLVSLYDFL